MKQMARGVVMVTFLICLFSGCTMSGTSTTDATPTSSARPHCGLYIRVAHGTWQMASVDVYEDACGSAYAIGTCSNQRAGIGVWFSTGGGTIAGEDGQGTVRTSIITPSTPQYSYVEAGVAQCHAGAGSFDEADAAFNL